MGKQYFIAEEALKDLKVSKKNLLSAVYRAKKQGDIISPAKGLYIIISPEYQPQGCLPAEQLIPILMRYLNVDYYAGLLTAAMYHGASHQKPGVFQVVLNKRVKRSLIFGKTCIKCIYKKSIKGLPLQDIVVDTGYLKISAPELTAMDLFLYQNKSGGLNHIATILSELVESLDIGKLISLVENAKQKAWAQRLGYVLEKIDPIDTEAKQRLVEGLANCLSLKSLSFIPLAPEMPITGCPRSIKWMIIENTDIESDL